jgi:hypothetical protein
MHANQRRLRTAAFFVAGALVAGALGPAGASAADERAAPMDRSFEVLLQKSIFSRDRSRGSSQTQPTAPATTARVLSPEQSVVFRGVLCPDEEYVAFIENVQTKQINIVKTGDEVARGRVAGITLDTLAYDAGGKVHQIRLGHNLAGETSGSGDAYTGSSSSAPTTGAASSGPVDPSQAAMIERLRQKRLKEGGN